jgi:hypothetical protein
LSELPSSIPITPDERKKTQKVKASKSTTSMAKLSGKEYYILQYDAFNLFIDHDNFMEKFYEAGILKVHNNFSYYKENYDANLEIIDSMLRECETYLSDEDLEYVLEVNPNFYANYADPADFDNLIFYLGEYTYEGRNWIYKHEIVEMRKFLVEKMAEYDKFILDITVNAGVQFAILRRNYPRS